jgi:hypothetical protein
MKLIKLVFMMIFLLITKITYPQTIIIQGQVSDRQGSNLVAVNAYLLHQNMIGTVTDLDGKFVLKISNPTLLKNESLVFSFISYNQLRINLDSVNYSVPLKITLSENLLTLNEVVVEGRKSISREFSIKEMDKLKIYLSPLASADPLKAVAMLPSSTNTSETANPELRGSTSNRTKVFLNGVPVSNPVRNSQINGIGFFSLFNPEIVKNMLVYPSNPPLIYGNTSAGMIDIQTEDKIENNNYQISSSLASFGICASQKINEKSFIQLYGNLMFSDGYLLTNPEIHKQLKSFNSNDFGINWHSEISNSLTFNFYNYLVSESSDVLLNLFTWEDNAKARTVRDFSVLNFKFQKTKDYLTLNLGTNFSSSRFSFGNIISSGNQQQTFLSFNYKHLFSDNFSLQTGLSNEYGQFHFEEQVPVIYYAMSPDSPSFPADTTMNNNLPETYIYLRWKPSKKLIWSLGARKNVTLNRNHDPDYLSLQTSLRYNILNDHSLLFSAGKYNNITEPNYTQTEFRLLSAKQIAFEYLY